MDAQDDRFFDTLPEFSDFEGVANAANYRPLPDHWALATADIVSSTGAIEAGRYKAVNMAGASVISALLNAFHRHDLPYVFGGDGALVAFPLSLRERARAALAAIRTWVAEELGLELRAAIVPVTEVRAAGRDVRVARFRASEHVSYAMFAGGGASWAEAAMKAGRYAVEAAPAGTRPDLTGLSCRWNPIGTRNGAIVSVIAVPRDASRMPAFQDLVADIVALAGEQGRGGHPVPENGPGYSIPPRGLDAEARAAVPKGSRWRRKLFIIFQTVLLLLSDRFGWRMGRFDARLYKRDVADNTDFRKFDDGLKMTIDVDATVLARIEARLKEAEAAGIADFGIHRQDQALMTCIVTTPLERDHLHFVDGAAGGYAMAAANLKAKLAA